MECNSLPRRRIGLRRASLQHGLAILHELESQACQLACSISSYHNIRAGSKIYMTDCLSSSRERIPKCVFDQLFETYRKHFNISSLWYSVLFEFLTTKQLRERNSASLIYDSFYSSLFISMVKKPPPGLVFKSKSPTGPPVISVSQTLARNIKQSFQAEPKC